MYFEEDGYRYEAMSKDSVEEAFSLYHRIFREHEPVAAHLMLSEKDMKAITTSHSYQDLISTGISTVVRHIQSNRIIAFRLASDFVNHAKPTRFGHLENLMMRLMDYYPVVFSSLVSPLYDNPYKLASYAYLESSTLNYWLSHHCPSDVNPTHPKQVIKMAGVGVLAEHRGRGIGWKSTDFTHRLAWSKGFVYSVVQCTNLYSQKLFERLGYKLFSSVEYDRFRYGNRYPFKDCMSIDGKRRELVSNFYHLDLRSKEGQKNALETLEH